MTANLVHEWIDFQIQLGFQQSDGLQGHQHYPVASAAGIYNPAPQAIPIDATTKTVAALVRPLTRLRLCRIALLPEIPHPAQCSTPPALCPHSRRPPKTRTGSVNSAHPQQIRRLVRRPDGLWRISRSKPITPPRKDAISKRVVTPGSARIVQAGENESQVADCMTSIMHRHPIQRDAITARGQMALWAYPLENDRSAHKAGRWSRSHSSTQDLPDACYCL